MRRPFQLVLGIALIAIGSLLIYTSVSAAAPPPVYTVTKVADNSQVNPGDNIGFSVSASIQNGTGAFSLQDKLPGGYTWFLDQADANCSLNNNLVFCHDLVTGEEGGASFHVLGVPFSTTSCGTVTNSASLYRQSTSIVVGSDSDSVLVLCPASLGIEKTVDSSAITPDSLVSFTITVHNSGDQPSGDFSIEDPLPHTLGWFISSEDGVDCSVTKQVLECEGSGLAGGADATVTVYAVPHDCGTYTNYSAILVYNGVPKKADAVSFQVVCPATPTPQPPTPTPTVQLPTATPTAPSTATAVITNAPGTPKAPNTGTGSSPNGPSNVPAIALFAILGLGVLVFGIAGTLLARRHSIK